MFKLKFGIPSHGWLPVRVEYHAGVLEFDASDVPNNPINELIDAVYYVNQGFEREIWWHLEPAGYYFKFVPEGNNISIEVDYSRSSRATKRDRVFTQSQDKATTLLSIWRELRKLQTFEFSKNDWPEIDDKELSELGILLKSS